VVKLNHGFSGEGNAVFSFAGCPECDAPRWIAAHLPLNLSIEARDLGWDRYAAKFAEQGGIVESWVTGPGCARPPCRCASRRWRARIHLDARPDPRGPSGQIFQACTFPADAAYARESRRSRGRSARC